MRVAVTSATPGEMCKHRSAPAQPDSDLTAPGAAQTGVSATQPAGGARDPGRGFGVTVGHEEVQQGWWASVSI